MERVSILFLPALLNLVMGGGIYYFLYLQTGSYEKATEQFQYWPVIYIPLISIFFMHVFSKVLKRHHQNIFDIKLRDLKNSLLGLAVGFIGGIGLYFLIRESEPSFTHVNYPLAFQMLNIVGLMVIAPLSEEFIFRRYTKFLFSLKQKPIWLAALVSGLSFSLWHANLFIIPIAFFVGIGFYMLYHKTNNLLTTILAHSALNLVLFLFI